MKKRKPKSRRGRPKSPKLYPTTIRLDETRLMKLRQIMDYIHNLRLSKGNTKQITFTEICFRAFDKYCDSYSSRVSFEARS